mmetsp:Transcript_53450/g.122322  ORF Transcript_53450/g.122322 Transcript_53450/m.122322 type:complete len:479 (+) Transcript_53450:67-1503(+)
MSGIEAATRKVVALMKKAAGYIVKGAPPKPKKEVQDLLDSLGIEAPEILQLYKVFHHLRQSDSTEVVATAVSVPRTALKLLVKERWGYVERILECLLDLGGCQSTVSWDQFLYIFLRFNLLSKIELAQFLFFVIAKEVKSWTVHYLTATQLQEFYDFYREDKSAKEPLPKSFDASGISFARLQLSRYYMPDFVELCHRFGVLLNPVVHLQRCTQQFLPSRSFWDDYDRIESFNRKLTLEFFMIKKTHVNLRGEAPLRESVDLLLPETLGGVPVQPGMTQEDVDAIASGQMPRNDFRPFDSAQAQIPRGSTMVGTAAFGGQMPTMPEGMASLPGMMDPTMALMNVPGMPSMASLDGSMDLDALPGVTSDTVNKKRAGEAIRKTFEMPGQALRRHEPDPTFPVPSSLQFQQDVKMLPPWMRNLVRVPDGKQHRSLTERAREAEFVRASRMRQAKQPSLMTSIESTHKQPLLDHSGKRVKR